MIRFAELLATRSPRIGDESAAVWLGRAQQVLGRGGHLARSARDPHGLPRPSGGASSTA